MNSYIYTLEMQFSALCNIIKPLVDKNKTSNIEKIKRNSGSSSSKNGTKYEKFNHNIANNTTLNGKPLNTQNVTDLGDLLLEKI